jgi:hypothetical protein
VSAPSRELLFGRRPCHIHRKAVDRKTQRRVAHSQKHHAHFLRQEAPQCRAGIRSAFGILGIDVQRDRQQNAFALPQPRQQFELRCLRRQRIRLQSVQAAIQCFAHVLGDRKPAAGIGADQLHHRQHGVFRRHAQALDHGIGIGQLRCREQRFFVLYRRQ